MPPFFALFAAAEGTGCIRDCMIGKSSESGKCFSHLFVLKIIARKVYFLFSHPRLQWIQFFLDTKERCRFCTVFLCLFIPRSIPIV